MITARFVKAVEFATRTHEGMCKKETSNPFIYHPLAVASLVLQYGGSEDQAMAAMIHDTIADHTKEELTAEFGHEVAELAYGFADPELPANPTWSQGKTGYLEKIKSLPVRYQLIIACEELHDLREIIHDIKHYPDSIWKRYSVNPQEIYWYYESLSEIFNSTKLSAALVSEFQDAKKALRAYLNA